MSAENSPASRQYTSIGGQAVVEGVMMRSPRFVATAVRRKDGSIQIKGEPFHSLMFLYPVLKKPIIRGIVTLVESMIVGIRSLTYSSEIAAEDEKKEKLDFQSLESRFTIVGSLIFAFILGIGLFVALPHGITVLLTDPSYLNISVDSPLFHFIDGVFKLIILTTYIFAIGRLPEIKRVFQYHGAEHQSIYTFEADRPLSVSEAEKFTPLHPRCGTSFLLFLVLISVVLFSILLPLLGLTRISESPILNHIGIIVSKILLMFPVAGISYELIKYSATRMNHPVFKALIYPGLKLQLLTTKKPNADQLEVALASLTQVLRLEKQESLPGEIRIQKLEDLAPPQARVKDYLEL